MRCVSLVALCLAVACPLLGSASAAADVFGPMSLASKSPSQQAEYAHDPAISADGRYLAFDGSFGGVTGAWRRDIQTGAVERVAGGDAELPSISEDGRYVSFTTTAALSPADHNEAPDVYVRDMSRGESEAGAFTLASAVDGGEEGLAYQVTGQPKEFGSVASGRSALSGDGRKVVFVTTAVSDLVGPRPPAAPSTPPLQVAVRDLDTHTTELASVAYPATNPPQPVEVRGGYGAVYPGGGSIPAFKAAPSYEPPTWIGASISADGSTVAWMGQDIGEQVPLLAAETLEPNYTEPLWRRIADGPLAPTRRITGGSDPANPACIASGEERVGPQASIADPCQGPFAALTGSSQGVWNDGFGDAIPRLSADGYAVAFLADAPLVSFGVSSASTVNNGELYVADMREGLTRDEALRPLTAPAGSNREDAATYDPIVDLGISPNGGRVAFTTMRTVFSLGSPSYVSVPSPEPGMLELFDVDLADETLTRVTAGYKGEASEHPHEVKLHSEGDPYNHKGDGALSPSYTNDGNTLAFASTASNLVYGDGNTPPPGGVREPFDGADAFTVSRVLFPPTSTETYISSPPATPTIAPEWRLGATALARRDGSVVLDVGVPSAGALRARATSAVMVLVSGSSRGRRARSRRPTVATREVARATGRASGGGLVGLTLRLPAGYVRLAERRGGLSAAVDVVFTSPGRPTLKVSLPVTFRRIVRAAKSSKARRVVAARGHVRGGRG